MPAAKRKSKPTRKPYKGRRNILPLVAVTGAAGAAGLTSAIPGYYRDAQGVIQDARGKISQFSSRFNPRQRRNGEDIDFLNEMAPLTSEGHLGFTQDGLEEFVRDGFVYHAFANTPVFEDGYRMGTPVEELAVMAQENPAKFDRCVKAVQKRGGAANAYAVCTAAGTRNPSAAYEAGFRNLQAAAARLGTTNLSPSTAQRQEWGYAWSDYMRGWNEAKKRKYSNPRRNPASEADTLYETFHGAPPNETLEIIETEHVHEHLAGLGELVEIVVKLTGGKFKGQKWPMKAPYPETAPPEQIIHLCSNESANQLYLIGGDQAVDVEAGGFRENFPIRHDGETFDVTDIRDLMVIGTIEKLIYRTQKAFDDFEVVDYFHKSGEDTKERPLLLYDSINKRLKIAGGEYGIDARGVIN